MQINKINLCTFTQKFQPNFKGPLFDEEDEAIISTSFRDDELFDPKRDFVDDMYRIYDYNELSLYAPKRALPVPQLFRETYDLKDSRLPEFESDSYNNDFTSLNVLSESSGAKSSDNLSIKDEFILRELSFVKTKSGAKLFDEQLNKSLKSFALLHPSVNQKFAKSVARVCKIDDEYRDESFSKSIFNIINRNCENLSNSKILSKIEEVQDFIDVALFREANGDLYWNTKVLNMMDSIDKVANGVSLDKQKRLMQACIVKDRLNNDRFLADAANFCFEKIDDCSQMQYDALLSAVRTGVQYDKTIQDYKFNKADAMEHYRDAISAAWNKDKSFEWNFPYDYTE